MKKSLSLLLTTIVSLFLLLTAVSCSVDSGITESNSSSTATGKISGKVTFSNVDESANGGIMVTLDKTDGLRTLAVSHSASSRSLEDSARTVVDNSITAKDGSYSFSNLEPGTYTVYAASTYSAERAVCTNVVVRSAETTIADTLKLTATGSIRGTITIDENESGNTGFLVFVAGTSYMAMTDDAGNYTISGVPAGSGYQLVATKNGVIFNLDSYVLVNANEATFMSSFSFSSNELDSALKGEKGEAGADGKDGTSLVWLGAYSSDDEIENPQYLNAYFNTTDGCSYIYNGYNWELLARSGANGADGKDGKSIRWRGEYSSSDEITDIQEFDAYYNTTNGCSYIYIWGWGLLASAGENGAQGIQGEKGDAGADGKSINWRGEAGTSDDISDPQELDAYYNATDGCSYIYMWGGWQKLSAKGDQGEKGEQGIQGEKGEQGASIVWRGSFTSADEISDPQNLDAYYNTTDGCSYIYIWGWGLLASAGENGAQGIQGEKGDAGADGKSINWRGEAGTSDDISDPQELDAYYNATDGCSYIYMWGGWQKLSAKGDQGEKGEKGDTGKSINWRGSWSSADAISNPQYLDAYYNTTDGCSYIYNGSVWNLLAKAGAAGADGQNGVDGEDGKDGLNGADGVSIAWKGEHTEPPADPELNWAYYNTETGCSYIWNGIEWNLLSKSGANGADGQKGENGVSIAWKGELSSAPTDPELNWAYYNTETGCSYIWNGEDWDLISKAGATGVAGADGKSLIWKGELDSAPTEAEINWAYYNTTAGYSYIWNGEEWEVLAKAGANGTSIIWKGELASAPENPKLYWAYYNTTDGCSYLYNGTAWELLAKAGTSGIAGVNGTSISWLGSFASSSEIANPVNLNAYYNTTDGCSYIYNGTEWQLLARKGSDGTAGSGGSGNGGITWLGDFADSSEITEPEVLSAYYNTTTGCSYIWNGTEWKLLAKGGTDGVNGEGITWMGSLPSDSSIVNPQYMYAYYNTTNGCSYIYTGSTWVLLAKAGADGQPYDGSGTTSQGTLPINGAYNIGDVLLNDGTVVPYSANRIFTDEQKKKAVGVMYGNEFGVPSGWLGIYNSCGGTGSGVYEWAKTDTAGYDDELSDIRCALSDNASVISGSFSGDTDGSDNWTYICSVDSTASKNAATNYPAFNYANKYASRFNLTGEYASGWYMPSFAELCFIYRNKTILNKVLSALGGIELQTVDYWSSSTAYSPWGHRAHWVGFLDGDSGVGQFYGSRSDQKRVCVVRPIVRDTTAPLSVSSLTATYSRSAKVITLSWTNPSASDLAYMTVSYTKNGTEIISNAPVFGKASAQASYTISNAEADGSEYVFTVLAIDKAGNKSTAAKKTITLNAVPEFTEFTIPPVNYLKEGNTVIATITGKNFNTASIDPSITFTATCPAKQIVVSNTSFTVQSDNVLIATFTIPGKVGEYDITVSYGKNSITGTFNVQAFAYSDGDVLLNDDTVIHYDANNLTFTDEQKAKAVGVLYCDEYGVPAGWLGLHNSSDSLTTYAWAKANTFGYTTNFTDIICSQKTSGSLTFFAGDTDGKDNWEYICDMYPVATAEATTNFPAFDYVNKYASTFGLTGEYASGWYMPSIAELYNIYKCVIVLNKVIKALGGTELTLATNYYYWSSSQSDSASSQAHYINLYYGTVYSYNKSNSNLVCVVRPFN